MTTRSRVLIVDNDDRVRFVLHRALLKLADECKVLTAGNAQDALELTKQNDFDLVIADLGLERMSGLQLTRALKHIDGKTMVIWITVDDCTDVRTAAHRLAVHECLEKPLEISDFRQVVREALAEIEAPSPARRAERQK
jgi:DNA-binding NtrC family response regulator